MIGKPIFDYPPERKAPEGEGCVTCGIVLEADAIGNYCSPECCEWEDRCEDCQRGPTWCTCEYTHWSRSSTDRATISRSRSPTPKV